MPGNDSGEIVVGSNGSVHVAALGVTAPSNATTSLATGWIDLGFLSDEGATFTDSRTMTPIPVWQSFYPARRIVTERDAMVAFTLRQWNTATIRLAFGGGDFSGTAPNFTYTPPSPDEIDERQLCLTWEDGDRTFRIYFPQGMVTESVATQVVRTGAADLPITFGTTPQAGDDPYLVFAADAAFSGYS